MIGSGDRSAREPAVSSYIAPVGKAPEHLAYMSAECASLNDAIRTGPARGLKSSTMSDLYTEYRRKCQEEESAAYQRLAQQRSEDRQERQTHEKALQAQVSQAQRSREQCDELLRILAAKRRQAEGMNAGEKADLQRFEASYNARCKT
jgi:septin family protein